MRPIPRDPLNPEDDGFDDDYIDDPDLPGEVPAPDVDDEVRGTPDYPGEQEDDQSPDEQADNLLDPDGDPSRESRPD